MERRKKIVTDMLIILVSIMVALSGMACSGKKSLNTVCSRYESDGMRSGVDISDGITGREWEEVTAADIVAWVDAGGELNPDEGFTPRTLSPFGWAISDANPAVICALLQEGADVNALIDGYSLPLAFATTLGPSRLLGMTRRSDYLDVLHILLAAGAKVNARDRRGMTALHLAATQADDPAVLRVLLDAGADVDARATEDTLTDEDIVRKRRLGQTPLHVAAGANENPEVIHVLIDAGAKVNAQDDRGRTPLHLAAGANESPEVVRVLIDAGAKVNTQDDGAATPLHFAATWAENPEVIRELLDAGADVNALTEDLSTAWSLFQHSLGFQDQRETDVYLKLLDSLKPK